MNFSKDLKGQNFGRLKTTGKYERRKRYEQFWECICSCKNKKNFFVRSADLKNGHTKSCGCLNKEAITKHNKVNTKIYQLWSNMKARCNNPNNISYKNYGGRGISHDLKWSRFEKFYDDMILKYRFAEKFYRKEITRKNNPLTLERKDVNGDYCKSNCCFIPKSDQAGNTRKLKWFKSVNLETGEEIITNNQNRFAKEHNLNVRRINDCLHLLRKQHKGWKFKYYDNKKE